MGIFNRDEQEKSDFEKIGVRVVQPFINKKNGRWVFDHEGTLYDMAPAGLTDAVLSPVIMGADRMIRAGCGLKNIDNPEDGFNLLFSNEEFPGCDVKLTKVEPRFDGWVYNVESVNLAGVMQGQQAWVCPYIIFYFKDPPDVIYLKMEPK